MPFTKKSYFLTISLTVLAVIGFFSCSMNLSPRTESGSVLVSIQIPQVSGSSDVEARFVHPDTQKVIVTVSGPGMDGVTKEALVSVVSNNVSIALDNVPPGSERVITVNMFASDDTLLAIGSTMMDIVAEVTNVALITAIPQNCTDMTQNVDTFTSIINGGTAGKTLVYKASPLTSGNFTITLTAPVFSCAVYNYVGSAVPVTGSAGIYSFIAATAGDYYFAVSIPVSYIGSDTTITVAPMVSAIPIDFVGLTADGASSTMTTTELILTFSAEPVGLTSSNISISGGISLLGLNVTGNICTLSISSPPTDGALVTVTLTNPVGYTFTTTTKTVSVYRDITAPAAPGALLKTTFSPGYWSASESVAIIHVPVSSNGVVGDILELRVNGTQVLSQSLIATDISAGFYDFSVSSMLPIMMPEGNKTFTAIETDLAGNVSPESSAIVVIKDTIPPTVNIIDPIAAQVIGVSLYTVMGTAADSLSGLALVEISIDGGITWTPVSGSSSWSYNLTALVNGPYTVTIRATDITGNMSTTSCSFSVSLP